VLLGRSKLGEVATDVEFASRSVLTDSRSDNSEIPTVRNSTVIPENEYVIVVVIIAVFGIRRVGS